MGNKQWYEIQLPGKLMQELENYLPSREGEELQEFFCQAIKMYLAHLKKDELKEELKCGYKEMGDINEKLADEGLPSLCRTISIYEEKLSECE